MVNVELQVNQSNKKDSNNNAFKIISILKNAKINNKVYSAITVSIHYDIDKNFNIIVRDLKTLKEILSIENQTLVQLLDCLNLEVK